MWLPCASAPTHLDAGKSSRGRSALLGCKYLLPHAASPAASTPYISCAVIQSELMWLDKDDLEALAVEYVGAEATITEKVEVKNKQVLIDIDLVRGRGGG